MAAANEISNPGLALSLSPYDPSGAAHLPADAVVGAALGCHVFSAPTALLVRDTARVESVHLLGEETIDDQARTLLEDVNIQAIKCGPVLGPEIASVLAEICADYPELPVVLHLTALTGLDDIEAEDALDAVLRLLLPLASLVVADHASLEQWRAEGMLDEDEPGASSLLAAGAHGVLVTGQPGGAGVSRSTFHGHHDKLEFELPHDPSLRRQDLDSLLSAAVTCRLALGQELDEAVEAALGFLNTSATQAFQPGMGHRFIDRTRTSHD